MGSSRIAGARGWPNPTNGMAFRVFTARWFWLLFGLVVGVCGTYIALHARYEYRPVSGSVTWYNVTTGQLRLVGEETVYRFTPSDFHPTLPRQIASGTLIVVWDLIGYPTIDAFQVGVAQGTMEAQYTDDYFDHPSTHLLEDRLIGGAFGLIGTVAVLTSLLLPPIQRRRRWLNVRGSLPMTVQE